MDDDTYDEDRPLRLVTDSEVLMATAKRLEAEDDDEDLDDGEWRHPIAIIEYRLQAALQRAQRFAGTETGQTMLDEMIFRWRVSGLSVPEIARKTKLSDDEVNASLRRTYDRTEVTNAQEMRTLNIARVEEIITAMKPYVESGSTKHAEMVLEAVERINKMLSLEVETTKIELQIVTDAQADMLITMAGVIVDTILNVPAVAKALSPEQAIAIVGEAMKSASTVVVDGQSTIIDSKELMQ